MFAWEGFCIQLYVKNYEHCKAVATLGLENDVVYRNEWSPKNKHNYELISLTAVF